jgi:hypothetical protein
VRARRRLKPLVWPFALLIAGGLTALLAEATTRSVETVTLYGMIKLASDLVLERDSIRRNRTRRL